MLGDVGACPGPSKLFKPAPNIAKPGADLYFSTINRNPSLVIAIMGAEYVLNLLPKGTEYDKLIKPSELARWARAAGLNVEAMIGLTNPIASCRLVKAMCR